MAKLEGAEAHIEFSTYLGRECAIKRRLPKSYRHATLDERIRVARTREEAAALLTARRTGIRVPILYQFDRVRSEITIEKIHGITLRAALDEGTAGATELAKLGQMVRTMHNRTLTHGDLTTSNVMIDREGLVLIDFGLANRDSEEEELAVDLHVLREALVATRHDAEELWQSFVTGYGDSPIVWDRYEEVEARGRYRDST